MELGTLAAIITFAAGYIMYPRFIAFLKNNKMQQTPSEFALDEYKNKPQTVTFGGTIFVLIPVIVFLLLRGYNASPDALLVAFIFVAYAAIGLLDDYKIVKEGKNDGLTAIQKLMFQFFLAVIFYVLYLWSGGKNEIYIPLVNYSFNLGYFYFVFILLFFAGFSNAVNLTDGMDGLAGGTSVIALLPLIYFSFTKGYLDITILLSAIVGALLSFLAYNRKPAQIFMGDVGSLALGALFASVAIILNMEIIMLIIGFVFVYETACVVLQQVSWRLRKKRIFRYTPIHYSYTLNGWKEKDVVYFFYALGFIFMILGIAVNVL